MRDPLITLTTDFGPGSPYVAAMKGVILGINPSVRLIDLSHEIPPQDIRHASFFLAAAIPHFPAEALHLIVVDPGVGTERALLYVEVAGQRLLVPDNGCWTELARTAVKQPKVIRLTESRYWRPTISATFHGRDIFAPVAGHLSLGLDPALLGPPVSDWVRLQTPAPVHTEAGWRGEVLFVDHFGNLITNIPGESLPANQLIQVFVGDIEIARHVRCYGEANAGSLISLISSVGLLEIAVVNGNAAKKVQGGVGTPVNVKT